MTKEKKSKKQIAIIISIVVLVVIGACAWYFLYKKPHDKAITDYNTVISEYNEVICDYNDAISAISIKNQEIDEVISSAQSVLDSGEYPYDESTSSDLAASISEAFASKVEAPALMDPIAQITSDSKDVKLSTTEINSESATLENEIENIISQTAMLSEPVDYSDSISDIQEKQKALEDSILVLKQITNPSEDFVKERLQKIDSITSIQSVTEDNDPNGNLNKQGGYTSSTYFASANIDQSSVYGTDTIDKGTEAGGCIEVYVNTEDAEKRNLYLSGFDGTALSSGSHTVLGTIVVRTSSELTASQQKELEQAIIEKFLELE